MDKNYKAAWRLSDDGIMLSAPFWWVAVINRSKKEEGKWWWKTTGDFKNTHVECGYVESFDDALSNVTESLKIGEKDFVYEITNDPRSYLRFI